jgi:hypothetical protein
MSIWQYAFCPSEIISEPPSEYLSTLGKNSPKDAAIIVSHLYLLCEKEIQNWPPNPKPISKNHYQLTAGNHRIYFGIYGRKLIVFYICRKMSQKAKPGDLNRARLNQEAYDKMCKEGI